MRNTTTAGVRPWRMFGAVLLTLAVLAIGGAVGYLNVRRLDDSRRLVSHTHEVVQSLDKRKGRSIPQR